LAKKLVKSIQKSAVRSNLQVLLAVVVALADVELPLAEPVEEADDGDDEDEEEAVPLDVDADALLVTEDPTEVEDTAEVTEEEVDPLPPAIVNWTL
jgi:hypothetical protein